MAKTTKRLIKNFFQFISRLAFCEIILLNFIFLTGTGNKSAPLIKNINYIYLNTGKNIKVTKPLLYNVMKLESEMYFNQKISYYQ